MQPELRDIPLVISKSVYHRGAMTVFCTPKSMATDRLLPNLVVNRQRLPIFGHRRVAFPNKDTTLLQLPLYLIRITTYGEPLSGQQGCRQ